MNDLVHINATELVAKMHSRELGAVEVFNAHAEAIEANNAEINALNLISTNPVKTDMDQSTSC